MLPACIHADSAAATFFSDLKRQEEMSHRRMMFSRRGFSEMRGHEMRPSDILRMRLAQLHRDRMAADMALASSTTTMPHATASSDEELVPLLCSSQGCENFAAICDHRCISCIGLRKPAHLSDAAWKEIFAALWKVEKQR